jgi:uncharacterized protein (DUF885 family)
MGTVCRILGKRIGVVLRSIPFGMLSMEMHCVIRLVVDAGMHAKVWTREEAIAYSLAHEAESKETIIAEVEGYMATLAQVLSYKIGQLKVRELRDRAKQV